MENFGKTVRVTLGNGDMLEGTLCGFHKDVGYFVVNEETGSFAIVSSVKFPKDIVYIKRASELMKELEKEDGTLDIDFDEIRSTNSETWFVLSMLEYCGKPLDTDGAAEWSWDDSWLETKQVWE